MKSKVRIELDENNSPVVELEFIASEDLRDKVAHQFRERFEYWSSYCIVRWDDTPVVGKGSRMLISPVPPDEMEALVEKIKVRIKEYKERIK
jgi:hypothetical protein